MNVNCANICTCAPEAEVQATRAVLLISLFLSAVAVTISIVGMKCTHFMDSMPESKSKTCMIGGILFIISGAFTMRQISQGYNELLSILIRITDVSDLSKQDAEYQLKQIPSVI